MDEQTIADWYDPRLNSAFRASGLLASRRWLDNGVMSMALAYKANADAGQEHHQAWLNAVLFAIQNAGLDIVEAYITRSIGLGLVGGGVGAAGGYRATGNPLGALLTAAIGWGLGSLIRAEVPIFQASCAPGYGWYLVPAPQVGGPRVEFGLA